MAATPSLSCLKRPVSARLHVAGGARSGTGRLQLGQQARPTLLWRLPHRRANLAALNGVAGQQGRRRRQWPARQPALAGPMPACGRHAGRHVCLPDFLRPAADHERVSEFQLKLMDITSENLGIPETEYSATVRTPSRLPSLRGRAPRIPHVRNSAPLSP